MLSLLVYILFLFFFEQNISLSDHFHAPFYYPISPLPLYVVWSLPWHSVPTDLFDAISYCLISSMLFCVIWSLWWFFCAVWSVRGCIVLSDLFNAVLWYLISSTTLYVVWSLLCCFVSSDRLSLSRCVKWSLIKSSRHSLRKRGDALGRPIRIYN